MKFYIVSVQYVLYFSKSFCFVFSSANHTNQMDSRRNKYFAIIWPCPSIQPFNVQNNSRNELNKSREITSEKNQTKMYFYVSVVARIFLFELDAVSNQTIFRVNFWCKDFCILFICFFYLLYSVYCTLYTVQCIVHHCYCKRDAYTKN